MFINLFKKKENFVSISDKVAIVRTQAGYRRALKVALGGKEEFGEYDQPFPYPKKYPCLVLIGIAYTGGVFRVTLKTFNLNELETIVDRMKNPQ